MRLTIVLAALLVAGTARANPYEAFIDVDSEEELYDLLASRQITDETFEVLIDLFHRGVDLNTAGREELYSLPNLTYDEVDAILAYRAEQGFIRDPVELVAAKVLTEDQLLAIAAFLVVRDPFAGVAAVHGFVQAQTAFTVGDDRVPPVALRTRVLAGRHLTAGAAFVLTRLRPGDAVYDPNRDALLVDGPAARPNLVKVYVHWDTDEAAAIAGTYRIGFGQRLTFDASSDYTPNGIYRDDQVYRDLDLARACREGQGELDASPCADDFSYVTADFRWREALLGAAAGLKHLDVGDGWLQLYGWGSFQPRSIYQYELYDASQCADPRDDDDPACAAPDVFLRPEGDRLAPAGELIYSTLPDMYGEGLVGGNATYFLSRRNYVGVIGYGATTTWLVDDEDLQLDFQEWSSRPIGGRFGAVGLTSSIGVQRFDIGAELAQSFDEMPDGEGPTSGGGGPAAIVRATYTEPRRHEVELSARYYDVDYVNPYARPIAGPDELDGQRARDEAGVRARFTGRFGALALRAGADAWVNPSDDLRHAEGYLRADVAASKAIRWGAWLDVHDRDRSDVCTEAGAIDPATGFECKGRRATTTGRVAWKVDRDLAVSAQASYELIDEGADGYRQDVSAWGAATWKPTRALRLRARVRYLTEDLEASDTYEESIWTYIEAWLRLRDKDRLRVRVDLYGWLDDRESTEAREPSPELRFWAMYDARF